MVKLGLPQWLRRARYPGAGGDPQETGMAAHSSILAQKIPWTGGPGGATVHGVAESGPTEHAGTNVHLK